MNVPYFYVAMYLDHKYIKNDLRFSVALIVKKL